MQDSDSDLDLQSCLGNAVSNISSIRETFSPKKRKPRIMKEKKVPGPSCGVSRILPYLLPPASKPPRFRGEADKDLIKDHCDAGYGYPQNPGQTSGRPKSVSLSYDMDTDEFYQFSVGLFPNLQGKVVSMYKMDKQRRLITVTPSLPSALRDNSYTGVTFFKGDEHTEDPGPVVGNPNPIEPIAERRAIIAVQDQAFEEALAEDRKKAQIEDEKKIQLQQQEQRLKQIHEDSLRITGEEPMGGVAIKVRAEGNVLGQKRFRVTSDVRPRVEPLPAAILPVHDTEEHNETVAVFDDTDTPTVSFHPRHSRLSLLRQGDDSTHTLSLRRQGDDSTPYRSYVQLFEKVPCVVIDTSEDEELHQSQTVAEVSSLKDGLNHDVGVLLAMAVVHCGQFPKFMSQTAYNSLLKDDIPISVMDIPDSVQRTKVQQLLEATSCDAIQEMMHENYVLFELAGCYKPATTFSESSRNKLVDDVVRFIVIGRNLPPIQQLRQGLQTFGLLDLMKDHSTQFNAGFLPGQTTNLTAEQVEAVFSKIEYSEIWSNKRREEECTIAYWRDYLIDIEERNVGVTFEDVLVFATGGNKVLYLGFSPDPSVEFVYDSGEKNFPLANTCSMVLRLPTVNSYEQFKNMDFGILNSPGFEMA